MWGFEASLAKSSMRLSKHPGARIVPQRKNPCHEQVCKKDVQSLAWEEKERGFDYMIINVFHITDLESLISVCKERVGVTNPELVFFFLSLLRHRFSV